jgi:hypothetical protein
VCTVATHRYASGRPPALPAHLPGTFIPTMNRIIEPTCCIRLPEHSEIGADPIVDDFCSISTRVRVAQCSHIVNSRGIAGGIQSQFALSDFSGLS